jgi:hypothetical protein
MIRSSPVPDPKSRVRGPFKSARFLRFSDPKHWYHGSLYYLGNYLYSVNEKYVLKLSGRIRGNMWKVPLMWCFRVQTTKYMMQPLKNIQNTVPVSGGNFWKSIFCRFYSSYHAFHLSPCDLKGKVSREINFCPILSPNLPT